MSNQPVLPTELVPRQFFPRLSRTCPANTGRAALSPTSTPSRARRPVPWGAHRPAVLFGEVAVGPTPVRLPFGCSEALRQVCAVEALSEFWTELEAGEFL